MMKTVYKNGLLNLAAIMGEESLGLECSRNPLGITPCVVTQVSSKPDGTQDNSHWMVNMSDYLDSLTKPLATK